MKNILILSSSPRKGGNSDMLCDEFMGGAAAAGHTVEKIFIGERRINFCTGCSTCSLHGKPCPQSDDMAPILDKMVAADIIVMATPVYFYTMCAQMKVLIDRCCGRYTQMSDKKFYFILSAAETQQADMERTVDTFQGFLDCLQGASLQGVVYGLGVWHKGEIVGNVAMKQAYDMGYGIE